MGTDGFVDLDQECWMALAKYNLVLAAGFGALAVLGRAWIGQTDLLVVENALLAGLFGAVQTYAWLEA